MPNNTITTCALITKSSLFAKIKDALSRIVLISNPTNVLYRTTLIATFGVIGKIQIRWSHVRVVRDVAVVVVIPIFWGKLIILLLRICFMIHQSGVLELGR